MNNVRASELASGRSSLLQCDEYKVEGGETVFNVLGAYKLRCPFQESFKFNLPSFTNTSLAQLISDSITFLILRSCDSSPKCSEFAQSQKNIAEFVIKGHIVPKSFKKKC